jgi:hypothetical protein
LSTAYQEIEYLSGILRFTCKSIGYVGTVPYTMGEKLKTLKEMNDEQLDVVRKSLINAAVTVGSSEAWWRAYFRAYPDKLLELAKVNLLPPQETPAGGNTGNQIIFMGAVPHSILDEKTLPGEATRVVESSERSERYTTIPKDMAEAERIEKDERK